MDSQNNITSSKIGRAAKLVGTGAKIGTNYLKYYAKKSITGNDDRDTLHQDNAEDIYDSLSNLKGSALKVAQMLSMDKNLLPRAYTDKFAMSQYSAPPMSGPLVIKTYKSATGRYPTEDFDFFDSKSLAAASIGQVHLARKGDKEFAIKIQYPGVSDSIKSDLRLVKPVANAMFGLSEKEMKKYFEEVEEKLLEETQYELELQRGTQIAQACAHLESVYFPKYYPEYSNNKVLVMDYIRGKHLKEYLETNPSQEEKNSVAQALWDFYEYQLHEEKAIHADPHPGNFLFDDQGKVGVIDFGCVKVVPEDFYLSYFPLLIEEVQANKPLIDELLRSIEIIFPGDSKAVEAELTEAFLKMTTLLSRPFRSETFHFTDSFLDEIYAMGEEIYQIPEVRRPTQPRGSKHALYVNRTYFGIYSIMSDLNANIKTGHGAWRERLMLHHDVNEFDQTL
jgi:predicted unusual protein kinase regulating ubiquinone biosynthesis (AarF/ABC1/UbiB family)